jgi:cytochrome c oxidase subunit 2
MFLFEKSFFFTFCDASISYQIGTQDPATPAMEGMRYFHNDLMFCIICIGVTVCWVLFKIIVLFNSKSNTVIQKFTHHSLLEIIWTLIPAIVLVLLAIPSFSLLYSLDELLNPEMTLKVIGHQWYWSYEYGNSLARRIALHFSSYLVPLEELKETDLRLLTVDNVVTLPIKTMIRILVTSSDVLHSWAVPSFGIKIDACPGRLSEVSLYIKRTGYFYGQCSEICGVNHGFMPIVVEGIKKQEFFSLFPSKK